MKVTNSGSKSILQVPVVFAWILLHRNIAKSEKKKKSPTGIQGLTDFSVGRISEKKSPYPVCAWSYRSGLSTRCTANSAGLKSSPTRLSHSACQVTASGPSACVNHSCSMTVQWALNTDHLRSRTPLEKDTTGSKHIRRPHKHNAETCKLPPSP